MPNPALKHKTTIESAFKLFQQGKLNEAMNACRQLLARNKKDPNALNLAGIISDAQGAKLEAVDFFKQAIDSSPDSAPLLTNLASTLIDLQNLAEAKDYLQKAIALKPPYAEAFYNLGNILLLEQELQKAKQYFDETLALDPKHSRALNNLAMLYRNENNNTMAKECYIKAIEISPNFVKSIHGLGEIYLEEKHYNKAEEYLIKALSLNNNSNDIKYLLSKLYVETKNISDKALAHIESSYRQNPQDEKFIHLYAVKLFDLGKLAEAEDLFLQVLEKNPNHLSCLDFLGRLNHELRRYETAEKYFTQALALAPSHTSILNNLGFMLKEWGKIDKSLQLFANAVEIDKTLPIESRSSAINNLAINQLQMREFTEGWDNFRFRSTKNRNGTSICPDRDSISLEGKNVLWVKDQGIGDELFFLRFSPLLEKLNCTSSYHCSDKLSPILKDIQPFENISSQNVDRSQYDYVFSIGDLPYLVNHQTSDSVPQPLPLVADIDAVNSVQQTLRQFGPPPYIGVTWSAGIFCENKRICSYYKEIDQETLCKIVNEVPGTIISLQKNASKNEVEGLSTMLERAILDVSSYHNNLDKMLALLSLLDENIGVSNTYVHMREGLAKKSHVFVVNPADWRWPGTSDKSFWMPHSTVYRQAIDGSWDDAVQQFKKNFFSSK